MKYKEEQKFRRSDVLLILLILIGGTAYRFIDILFFDSRTNSSELLLASVLLIALSGILFFLLRLKLVTKVGKKGIQFQFSPLHRNNKKIRWKEVDDYKVVTLPFEKRISYNGTREAVYSFNGRTGLELHLRDGRRLFLGSRDPEELAKAMEKFAPI